MRLDGGVWGRIQRTVWGHGDLGPSHYSVFFLPFSGFMDIFFIRGMSQPPPPPPEKTNPVEGGGGKKKGSN